MLWLWLIVGFALIVLGLFIFTQGGQNIGPAIATMGVVIWLILLVSPSRAQEHRGHPPEHQSLHSKFYSTWMRPDNRAMSCCHDEDCKPAQSKRMNGTWFSRFSDDDEWTEIPTSRIETERDSPDAQSHLCKAHGTVYCFLPANGS